MWSRRLAHASVRPARSFGAAPPKPDSHSPAGEHASQAATEAGLTTQEIYKKIGGIHGYFLHQQDFFMRHNPPNKSRSLTELLRALPAARSRPLVKLLARETTCLDSERPVSDLYSPPKVHENAVFLYQTEHIGTMLLRARRLELPMYLGLALIYPSVGISAAVFAGLYLAILRASHYELANRLVLRMDLLPHLESVGFQKVGPFGTITTRVVRLADLEKTEPRFSEENAFWGFNVYLDRDLVYRDKATGELFVFDNNGLWSWEGISHKLLY